MDRCLKTRLREYPSVSVSKGSETEREADFQAKALPERSPRLEGRRERRAECRFLDWKSGKPLFHGPAPNSGRSETADEWSVPAQEYGSHARESVLEERGVPILKAIQ